MAVSCAFCRVGRGEAAGHVVLEDARFLAFLDHRPLFPGHTLLVPRAHHETLADLPTPLVGPLFEHARLLARAVERAFGADGSLVAINNRVSQSVPHLHVHFFWPRTRYASEAAAHEAQRALRAALEELRAGGDPV